MSIGERQIVRTIPGVDGDPQAWAEPWQQSWDLQQQGFLFDREQRFAALLDLVEAAVGPAPTVVDLACGTASITRRLLARLPGARAVAVDVDPVLLTIARASLGDDERVRIVRADLRDPEWADALGGVEADAVVTSTALHWLPEAELARVYRDLAGLVRPGGLVANADTMPSGDLPGLTEPLTALAEQRVDAALANGVEAWQRVVAAGGDRPRPRRADGRAIGTVRRGRPSAVVQPARSLAPRRAGGSRVRRGRRGLAVGHRRHRRRHPLIRSVRAGTAGRDRRRPRRDWSPRRGVAGVVEPSPNARQ